MTTPNELFAKVLRTAAESAKPTSGLFGLLSDNSITLKNLLFSAVVVGLQLLLSSKVFDCPLNNHVLYGVLFLVSPFFIVLIMNVLLVGNPWDITDRCCIERYRRRGNTKWCSGECCYWVLPNIAKAFVGPCVWLIASFADTEYYVCAAVGQDIEKRNLTNVTEIEELEAEFADAKARSVIAAWFVFGVLTLGIFFVLIVKKCCLKDNVLLEDEYYFERREAIAAVVTFRHYISHGEQGDVDKGEENNNQANLDSTAHAITRENGSGAGEDKKEDEKKKKRKKGKDKKKEDKIEVEMTPTSPGTSASGTDMGVSVPGSRPIASSVDVTEPAPASPNVKASASSAMSIVSAGPSQSAGEDKKEDKKKEGKKEEPEPRKEGMIGWFKKILGVGQDEKKDEENKGEQRIVGRFMGEEEEITVYPEGIPEQEGKKWVEEQFDGGKHYLAVYKEIEEKYPRVMKGQPWKPWVKKPDDGTKKKKNSTACPQNTTCLGRT